MVHEKTSWAYLGEQAQRLKRECVHEGGGRGRMRDGGKGG